MQCEERGPGRDQGRLGQRDRLDEGEGEVEERREIVGRRGRREEQGWIRVDGEGGAESESVRREDAVRV